MKFSLKNGVTMLLLTILILASGVYSMNNIKVETFPDVTFPAVFVQVIYPNASSEEVEKDVTTPIEDAIKSLKGYDTLTSTSMENSASISVTYDFGQDMDEAKQKIEDTIQRVKLPDDADVTVARFSAGQSPIYEVALSSKTTDATLQDKIETQLVPKLEKVSGINSITLKGTKTTEVQVTVDEKKLTSYNLTLDSVKSAIQQKDFTLPLGTVEQKDNTIPVQLYGRLSSVEQLKNIPFTYQYTVTKQVTVPTQSYVPAQVPTQQPASNATSFQGMTGNAAQASSFKGMTGNAAQASSFKGTTGSAAQASSFQGTTGNATQASSFKGTTGSATQANSFQGTTGNATQQYYTMKQGTTTQSVTEVKTKQIKLADFATVRVVKTADSITRYNGKETYLITATKTQDANTADVVNDLKAELKPLIKQYDLSSFVVQDQGKEVEKSVSSLIKEGGYGALFTIIVIMLFLRNIRATLIAIISLPISIFGTITVLDQLGYTLNIMTLGGMAVAIGRIVDDSIVVIENIYRWKQEHGDSLTMKQLAYRATKEVVGAIASSTIATVVVFLPLAVVSGILGEFFRPFSIAVASSIIISLLVSLFLIPTLGSILFKKVKHHEEKGWLVNAYDRLLAGALARKWIVIVLSIALLVGSVALVPQLGVSFLPSGEVKSFNVTVDLPSDTKLADSDKVAKRVEAYIAEQKGIDYSSLSIGSNGGRRSFGGGKAENKLTFFIQLKDGVSVEKTSPRMQKDILALAKETYPEATSKAEETQTAGPPSGNNITIKLYSDNYADLKKAAGQVDKLLSQRSDVKNVKSNLDDVKPKWQVLVNKAGRDVNVNPYSVMSVVSSHLQRSTVGTYTVGGAEQKVTIGYKDAIVTEAQLNALTIQTEKGVKKLGEVTDIRKVTMANAFYHDDGKAYAQLSADFKGDSAVKTTADITKDIESLPFPSSVTTSIGGGSDMIQDGFQNLGLAMVAAIGLVFIVLSVTFGGLRVPLIILSSLIFVPIGSLGGLLITGQTLSMSAMIGMLMLIGIVVTNAVVLLDRIETNRRDGMELIEAIREAGTTRLRPILMTAFATIFALVPLALSEASSSLISKGLAVTVIGGLTTSTLLTLLLIPVLYALFRKKAKVIEPELE